MFRHNFVVSARQRPSPGRLHPQPLVVLQNLLRHRQNGAHRFRPLHSQRHHQLNRALHHDQCVSRSERSRRVIERLSSALRSATDSRQRSRNLSRLAHRLRVALDRKNFAFQRRHRHAVERLQRMHRTDWRALRFSPPSKPTNPALHSCAEPRAPSILPRRCATTLPPRSQPPNPASQSKCTSIAKIRRDIADRAVPAPMNRTARRALVSFRVTTAPIFQPSSRSRRPNARPTRPAPTIASVSVINLG